MTEEQLAKLSDGARMVHHRNEAVRHLRAYSYSPATDNGGMDAKVFAALMAQAIECPELRDEMLECWAGRGELAAQREVARDERMRALRAEMEARLNR